MKLVMTILCKNEADIIEDNIRFHSAQGVDAFLVMDNASSDETPNILERLKSEFDITVVHNSSSNYHQAKWMTGLAKKARKELAADFVISNDADEFWACKKGGSLKSYLCLSDAVLTVKRFNYVQSAEDMEGGRSYWLSENKVSSPILYSKEDQLKRPGLAMPLVKISPKTIVNPKGLIKIRGGNHWVRHLKFWGFREELEIEVHHFPIRSYEQFEANIKNRQRLLEQNSKTKMGDHYRRWVTLLKQGKLIDEFSRMALTEGDLAVLNKVGVIDYSPSHVRSFFKER